MHPHTPQLSPLSDYYVHMPTPRAKKLLFYPLTTGYNIFNPGFMLEQGRFEGFLLMYITKGTCSIKVGERGYTACAGQFILLDLYAWHEYGSADAWEDAWLYFNGPMARAYYEEITSLYGHVLAPLSSKRTGGRLVQITQSFRGGRPFSEAVLSAQITALLNDLLLSREEGKRSGSHSAAFVSESIAYIEEHFHEEIPLELLSRNANVSLYHFTRVFTRVTGMTPHRYILQTRISAAKFLLKTTQASVKDVAFSTGFNSESSFCAAFKKWEGSTPSQYRSGEAAPARTE